MIAVILHCYTINDWEEKFLRQVNRLKTSGLYEGSDEIYIYITDPSNTFFQRINSILSEFPKVQLHYSTTNHGEGYKALCKVDELGKQFDNYKILYFHTKGVYNKYKNFSTGEVNYLKLKGVETWVEMMEYFLIDNWKECVNKLEEFDNVGVSCNNDWWWGNFWWTSSKHIKNNIPFSQYYRGSRWLSESWLHDSNKDKSNIKKYEMFHFHYDPCYSFFPKYFYDGTDLSQLELNILKAEYGYFAEQRDEGQPTPLNDVKTIDVTSKVNDLVNKFDKKKILLRPYEDTCDYDPAPNIDGLNKCLRITFKTNFDDKEYVLSSFMNTELKFGHLT